MVCIIFCIKKGKTSTPTLVKERNQSIIRKHSKIEWFYITGIPKVPCSKLMVGEFGGSFFQFASTVWGIAVHHTTYWPVSPHLVPHDIGIVHFLRHTSKVKVAWDVLVEILIWTHLMESLIYYSSESPIINMDFDNVIFGRVTLIFREMDTIPRRYWYNMKLLL